MFQSPTARQPVPLQGPMLMVKAIVLAMSNFLAVLNMTIANVTQPNMAGALGASTSQGTWIITAYAVAEHHRAHDWLAHRPLRRGQDVLDRGVYVRRFL